MTVISNELCKEYLVSNSTRRKSTKKKIDAALKNGLNYGFLCAQGIFTENGIFTGACKVLYIDKLYILYIVRTVHTVHIIVHIVHQGDSGGPLTVGSRFDPKDPDTLVGIVSGGVGCSIGTPGWYTRYCTPLHCTVTVHIVHLSTVQSLYIMYTRVSFYFPWIGCIIQASKDFREAVPALI